MKNPPNRINCRLNTEEKISELEDIVLEIIQDETHKGEKFKQIQSITDLRNNFTQPKYISNWNPQRGAGGRKTNDQKLSKSD